MLIRIVKMTFDPAEVDNFLELFDCKKDRIRNFEGCTHLELLRDQNDKTIFFTYSYWKDAEALENYRQSELFKQVWTETKKKFAGRAEAWSLGQVVKL